MGTYWQTIGPWNDDDFDQIDSMLVTFPEMLEKVLGNPQIVHYRLDTLAFFNTESEDKVEAHYFFNGETFIEKE
jgi:hypothetical protein